MPLRPAAMMANRPLRWGFLAAIGALGAVALAVAVMNLYQVLIAVFFAAFVALGLDPAVRWFQRRGLSRALAVLIVVVLLIAVLAALIWIVLPPAIEQATLLITTVPQEIQDVLGSEWFERVDESTNGAASEAVLWIESLVVDPTVWATVGGGALRIGATAVSAVSTGVFVVILAIYFVATLSSTKRAGYALVSASRRPGVVHYADRIMDSVGSYVSGMVIVSTLNAVFSTILLLIVGVPFAIVIGVVALFVTLIPMIGTIIMTVIMTVVALFTSPVAAVVVLVAMLVYMQVEAYLVTPKVLGSTMQIPGTVVLIAAFAGGALLGLLGAFVAVPIAAGILLILREVVMPRKARM